MSWMRRLTEKWPPLSSERDVKRAVGATHATSGGRIMSKTAVETEALILFPRAFARDKGDLKQHDARPAELQAALAREQVLLQEKEDLSRRQVLMAEEFEHRLLNGLQLIVSLLSLQSRTAPTREAADQLTTAARRVSALGRVHRRLHLLDHLAKVELRKYLQHLCEDLSGLLAGDGSRFAIVVEGARVEIATALAIPLGFIVNELITNSAKYAEGRVTVRTEMMSPEHCALSVLDDGPGLPVGFAPADSKGLGMKIVLSLVEQIGGALHILPGNNGRGTCFTVTFRC
jgi:two-component sensor histidine kinase